MQRFFASGGSAGSSRAERPAELLGASPASSSAEQPASQNPLMEVADDPVLAEQSAFATGPRHAVTESVRIACSVCGIADAHFKDSCFRCQDRYHENRCGKIFEQPWIAMMQQCGGSPRTSPEDPSRPHLTSYCYPCGQAVIPEMFAPAAEISSAAQPAYLKSDEHDQRASSSSGRAELSATSAMSQLNQLPDRLVDVIPECFSLRPCGNMALGGE